MLVILLLGIAGGISAQTDTAPDTLPDAAGGLLIYQDRCANCHGVAGMGDGELAADLPNPPTAHADPEYLRLAVPAEMFDLVTNGRVEKGMPPFGPSSSDPLSDSVRWDVIATIYSMGTQGDSIKLGMTIYQDNCLACHGEEGKGDGPDAADLAASPGDLTSPDYWRNQSNQAVFDDVSGNSVAGGEIAAHQYDLTEDELWSVVDYMRTFSYAYFDVLAMFESLETASISGLVTNGTTGGVVNSETSVLLRGFTQDLQPTLTMSETLDANGRYTFDLTDVPQEWFYRVALTYDDVDFGSDFGQLSFQEPELDLPITVFDKTSDPSAINIDQVHLVITFGEGIVGVSELYVANNSDTTVFVGESGDINQGTFKISVPPEAESVSFQRGFGSVDSFIPANEFIQTDDGWADTFPLRPGPGSLTMLVQYTLPYDEGMTLSHTIHYPTNSVNLVMPDAGVSVDETGGWVDTGKQNMGSASVATYGQNNLPGGGDLTLTLEGKPRQVSESSGNLIRDNAAELLVGIAAAVVVVVVAAVMITRWRQEPEEALNRDDLIQAIADLDDEYEAGGIGEEEYHRQREQMMVELKATWGEDNGS